MGFTIIGLANCGKKKTCLGWLIGLITLFCLSFVSAIFNNKFSDIVVPFTNLKLLWAFILLAFFIAILSGFLIATYDKKSEEGSEKNDPNHESELYKIWNTLYTKDTN